MGSTCKREIRRGETSGAAMMLIRVGYDMALHFPQPTAMVLMQSSILRGPRRSDNPSVWRCDQTLRLWSSSMLLGTAAAVMTSGQRHRWLKEDVICRDGPQRV